MSHTSLSYRTVRTHAHAGARTHAHTDACTHARTCNRTHAHEDARTLTHSHTHPQLNRRSGSKGGSGMHFKLGHRELLSYLAPLKPCSADASHALLRLRLIGLGTTEPPPFDGAGRPRRNACALGIRDRSSRCIYAQKCLSHFCAKLHCQSVARCVFGFTLRLSRRHAPSRLDLRGQPWEHGKLHGSAWVHRICTAQKALGWPWYMR